MNQTKQEVKVYETVGQALPDVKIKLFPWMTSPLAGEDVRRTGEGDIKKSLFNPLIGLSGLRPSNLFPRQGGSHTTGRRGFTLIELLVVVLIIGILAAVAVPQYQKAVTRSRISQMKVIARQIYEAQRRLSLAGERFTTFDVLDVDFGKYLNSDKTVAGYDKFNCMSWGCRVHESAKWPHLYIGIRGNPTYWYCCWEGDNPTIKQICQSEFPQGTYLPNAPQYGYQNEQCIRTPF